MFIDFHKKLASVMAFLFAIDLFFKITKDENFSFFLTLFLFGCIFIVIYSNSYLNKSLDFLLSLPVTRKSIFKFYIKWNSINYLVYSFYFFVYYFLYKLFPNFLKIQGPSTKYIPKKEVLGDPIYTINFFYSTEYLSIFFLILLLFSLTIIGNPSHANQKMIFINDDRKIDEIDNKKVHRKIVNKFLFIFAVIMIFYKTNIISYNLVLFTGLLFFTYYAVVHNYYSSFFLHSEIKKKIFKKTIFLPISITSFLLLSLFLAQNSNDPNVQAYSKLDYDGLPVIGLNKDDSVRFLRDKEVYLSMKRKILHRLNKNQDEYKISLDHKVSLEKLGLSFSEVSQIMHQSYSHRWIKEVSLRNIKQDEFLTFLNILTKDNSFKDDTNSTEFNKLVKFNFSNYYELFKRNDLLELMKVALSHKSELGNLFYLKAAKFIEDESIHQTIALNWDSFIHFPNSFRTLQLAQYGKTFSDQNEFLKNLENNKIGRTLSSQEIFCEQIIKNIENFELSSTNPLDYQKLNQCLFKLAKPENRGALVNTNLYTYENRLNENNPLIKELGQLKRQDNVY